MGKVSMPTYTRTATQDTSIIIQEAWFRAHTMGLGKIFDWVNPYPVPTIYSVQNGVVETWDDEQAYAWIRDQLHIEIARRPEMIHGVADRYAARLRLLGEICQKGCPKNTRAFLEYLEFLLEAVIDFIIIYHLAGDERTPPASRDAALALRDRDTLFTAHDRCIRESLLCIHPEVKGYETVIRYREVKYDQMPSQTELEARTRTWVVIPGEYYELGTIEAYAASHPSIQLDKGQKG